jgi:hypothetical protein
VGDSDRGEPEGNLEKKPDEKRRLEGGMEWKVARCQYAFQMLLEGKAERWCKREQRQQTTRRRRPTGGPHDEASSTQQREQDAEGSSE